MAPSQLTQSMAEIRALWSADELRRRRKAALRAQSLLQALVGDIVYDADTNSNVFAAEGCTEDAEMTDNIDSRFSQLATAIVA